MCNLILLFLDVGALIVYLDLYLILNYKKRIFTFLFEWQVFAQKQLKPYQNSYYASLRRDWFCVLDKIPVSGFFAFKIILDILTFTTLLSIVLNVCDMLELTLFNILRPNHAGNGRGVAYTSMIFYIQSFWYTMVFLYAMVSYGSLKRDMCFHCKYGFFMFNSLSLAVLVFGMMESLPIKSFSLFGFMFFGTLIAS